MNYVNFPASSDGIDRTVPIIAKALALSERKVVDDAGGEVVIELNLRQSPVGILGSRQREICAAGAGSYPIRKSVVEVPGIGVARRAYSPCLALLVSAFI